MAEAGKGEAEVGGEGARDEEDREGQKGEEQLSREAFVY